MDLDRGLLLRTDHGRQYLSDHFIKQVKSWGIKPSFAFVEQTQTNGVAERFNRTLKEQAIYPIWGLVIFYFFILPFQPVAGCTEKRRGAVFR